MSSLFSALTVAVGGLTAQSEALGNISDNLANSQTTGFKSIGTQFEDLVTVSNASSNNPGGVRATPSYQNDVQGNITSSATTTSLAISGQGFFPVETTVQNADGSTSFTGSQYYTRQGDFTLDKNGYLVNGSNYYLQGYTISATGVVDQSSTAPIQVSALLNNPVASTSATYDANLPASQTTNYQSSPSVKKIYDALGNTYDMSFTWTKTGTNAWSLSVDVANGVQTTGTTVSGGVTSTTITTTDKSMTIPFVFNSSSNTGTVQTIGGGPGSSGSGFTVIDNTQAAENKAQISFSLHFPGSQAQTMTVNFGDYNAATGLTQFGGTTAGTTVSVSDFTQNGLASGAFSNLSINDSGIVSINYNNGSTRQIAQIPLVQFYAQDQLQRVSGGAYQATLASGSPRIGQAGTNGAGTISSSSLESSNVDIATQFTNMVQAQQIYSANAKAITTINGMLTTIINTVQ